MPGFVSILSNAVIQFLKNDIWIAAACLDLEVPLLSQDDHFNLVPGLNVISWVNSGDS
jgi:predicted nucleic acid-binding protein